MAFCRRNLVSGFSYLSVRPRFLFSHLLSSNHDPGDSTPSQPSSSPIPTLVRNSVHFKFNRGISTPFRDLGFFGSHIPSAVELRMRTYSSIPEGSNEIEVIREVSDFVAESSTNVVYSVAAPAPFPGEVAAAAADSFLPVAALQHLIDGIHSFTGLNWWVAIALTTILIRGATVPILINQMKATFKLNELRPEMELIKEQMQINMDPQSLQESQRKMEALFRKHGVTPFTPLMGMFIQGPLFICFYLAISNMVEKVPSFKGGGAFWFTDLTTPDPMYALPVLTAVTFLATVEWNMQEGIEGNPMAKSMKNFSRLFGLLTIPLTAGFPKAIFLYWTTSNLFSLVYGLVLRQPPVRKFLALPEVVPRSAPPPSFSFFGSPRQITPAAASPLPGSEPEQAKSLEKRASLSSVINQRIKHLEKTVKGRSWQMKKQ